MRGLARDRKKRINNSISCRKCGATGGTLVKIDTDHYEHQDSQICRMVQLRRSNDS